MSTARVYSGWHGCTDPNHVFLAVTYDPGSETLGCRFNTAIYYHFGVPAKVFHMLTKTPFALAYYRKHVMNVYRGQNEDGIPLPFKPKEPVSDKHLPRVQEIPNGTPRPQMSLFIELDAKKKRKKRAASSLTQQKEPPSRDYSTGWRDDDDAA